MHARMFRFVCAMCLGLALLVGISSPTGAQTAPPPSLAGEFISSQIFLNAEYVAFDHLAGSCNPDGTSVITFGFPDPTTGGTIFPAVGPYPGTPAAGGSFSFGPQGPNGLIAGDRDQIFNGFAYTAVPLESFEETFAIDSPVGQVEGTKSLISGSAACAVAEAGEDTFSVFVTVQADVRYEATITTAQGVFADSGTAHASGFMHFIANPTRRSANYRFDQTFLTSDGVVALSPTTKEQCKNGGYAVFGFPNQGQCIQFVNNGK